jgi:3-deoxy-D-manno-octulosonate 8-phosphate phosphatase (KDO 8-P phosphatase)
LLPDGREAKAFHVRDGLAIVLAHAVGLKTGLVSGRTSEVVERRARELAMAVVRQGVRDKRAVLAELLAELAVEAREVAYIGDDINDLPVMAEVGLSAAPADAPLEVKAEAYMVMSASGGRGCLREFVEAILRARGDWERALAAVGLTP